MIQRYFAKTRKILQRSFGLRFYERLSSFCYRKLKENYLSPARKIIFLFLLMLCAEITVSLGAPVLRSIRISLPYATTLSITEHNQKLFFLGKSCIRKAGTFFVGALRYSSLMPKMHSYNSVISASVQAAVFTLFTSLTKLLIRDDRIIGDTEIKLSPIKAQGPPFFKRLFTASFLTFSLSQYLFYCAIAIIAKVKKYSLFASILAIFSAVNAPFFNLKTYLVKIVYITRRYFKSVIFSNWLNVFIYMCFSPTFFTPLILEFAKHPLSTEKIFPVPKTFQKAISAIGKDKLSKHAFAFALMKVRKAQGFLLGSAKIIFNFKKEVKNINLNQQMRNIDATRRFSVSI